MTYALENAQADLMTKRANLPALPRQIDDVVATAVSQEWPEDEQPTAGRLPERVTLGQLEITHAKLRTAVAACHRWRSRKLDGFDFASIVLVGPYGTGKTHIAKALLWSMCYTLDDGTPVAPAGKFYEATDLLMKMNPTRTDWGGQEVPRPSDFLGNIPILVIDDVGAEQNIPFVSANEQEAEKQARYFRVINYCYTHNISIVLTGNIGLGQLSGVIGGRAWDRLCEMAPKGFMVDLTSVPSWRQRQSGR